MLARLKLMKTHLNIWTYVTLLGFVIVLGLLVFPLSSVFTASFIDNETGEWSLTHYGLTLGTAYYRNAIWNSLIVSFLGMAGAVLLGVPLAYYTTRFAIKGNSILSTLAIMCMISPPFIGAYAWIMILGSQGFLRKILLDIGLELPKFTGLWAIILVYSLQYFPFVYLLTSGGLKTVNRSLEECAENLGATARTKFFKITLPLVTPSLTAGALITFMLALSNFGTPMLIGGKFRVLATMAFNFYTSEVGGNPGMAATLSLILILCAFIVLFLQRYIANRKQFTSNLINKPLVRPLKGWKAVGPHLICYGIIFWGILPLVVVIYSSFRNVKGPVFHPGLGYGSYPLILPNIMNAAINTAIFAVTAVFLIMVIGTLIGFVLARYENLATSILDPLLMLPYIVPGTVLGISFIVAFNKPPVYLTGTAAIIVMAYFIRRLPYSIRASAAILKQIKHSTEEAAINLGAPPLKAFTKVTLPMMIPGIIAGGILTFVTTINELSASVVLYVGNTVTMPIKIFILAIEGDFGPASALATIMLLITGIAIFAIYKLAGGSSDTFIG